MAVDAMRDEVARALSDGDGIVRLAPAWVARDFLPPGRRFGLAADAYDLGERGFLCERWLGSTTRADNRVGPPDEGLSHLALEGVDAVTLKDAVEADPVAFMGEDYAQTHAGLGRLAKIFDYSTRLPLHLHQRQEHAALVGRRSKDEAYYFPDGIDMGPHPETFLGVNPWIAEDRRYDVLLPYLEDWDSDLILQHTRGYRQVAGQGFFVPSGVLHAPGSALTIELQEDSDVFAMLQALNAGDPHFYENHHLLPMPVEGTRVPGCEESWIFYDTPKFSGKRLVVEPGCSFTSREDGVHTVFVWRGSGTYGGLEVRGGEPGLDEVIVTHDRATRGVEVRNTGAEELMLITFFGPDVNRDVPTIARR
jgi:hypothetical protein